MIIMTAGINKIILLGTIQNVEVKENGFNMVNLTIRTTESWRDRNTDQLTHREENHIVTCFGKVAEIAQGFLANGTWVYVEAKFVTKDYTDKKTGQEKKWLTVQATSLQILPIKSDHVDKSEFDEFNDVIPF
jgi:single-strand DNA-binding protein